MEASLQQDDGKNPTLTTLSEISGWIYFVVWSLSFYGQTYTNWKLKSVEGMKLDYIAYNLTGYLFYGISNTYGYFGNPAKTGLSNVKLQDLLFTYHGEILVFVKVIQCFIYPRGNNTLSKFCIITLSIMWAFIIIYFFLTNVFDAFTPPLDWNTLHWLGYIKLIITLIKYVPQVYWNYERKSTKGWSIFNVICDIIGGVFSIIQDVLDTINGDEGNFVGLNLVKFLLGVITIFFDLIFITQHYIIYPQEKQNNHQILQEENNIDQEQLSQQKQISEQEIFNQKIKEDE